jgi:hypothetical protein
MYWTGSLHVAMGSVCTRRHLSGRSQLPGMPSEEGCATQQLTGWLLADTSNGFGVRHGVEKGCSDPTIAPWTVT